MASAGGGAIPKPFGGARLIIVGLYEGTNSGWYLSSAGFADGAIKLNSASGASGATQVNIGPPGNQRSETSTTDIQLGGPDMPQVGQRAYTLANGVLYYEQGQFSGTNAKTPRLPVIRRLSVDGNTDHAIVTIPDNPLVLTIDGGVVPLHSSRICSMVTQWGNGDILFCTVVDVVTSGGNAGLYGRVMMVSGLDSGAYTVTEVYNSLNTNSGTPVNSASQTTVPYILENFLGQLYIGFYRGSAIPLATICQLRVDSTQPDGWGCTKIVSSNTATYGDVTCMRTYNGVLYVGYQNYDPAVTAAVIESHFADGTVAVEVTPTGGTILTLNHWTAMEVFNGNLYAAWWNGAQAVKIFKYDGTTWTTVFTATAGQRFPLNLRADGNYLYAWGGTPLSSTSQVFLASTDGSSWTDQTARFITTVAPRNFTNSSPLPVLFGIDQ